MPLFKRKPPPAQPSLVPPISPRPSANPGISTKPSVPKPGTVGTGTLILEETKAARATAQEAVNILQEMRAPGEAESGPLDEVKALLQAICTKLATLDDRLSAIEQRLPAPRLRLVP